MIENVWHDKFLNDDKDRQVGVAADLVKDPFLVIVEERELLYSSQRFGHEPLCKIEFFIAADNVLDTPINFLRCSQRVLIVIGPDRTAYHSSVYYICF